jgi:hypothetical protein
VLKRLTAGVLATAIVAGGASVAFAGAGDDDGDDDGNVIRVTATIVNQEEIDLPPSGFGAGDRVVLTHDLQRDGEDVGRSGAECTFVRSDATSSTAQCLATFDLPGGQITVQGLVTFRQEPEQFTVAVTGGTGRYRDADGELIVEPVSETEEQLTFRLD